MAPVFMMAQAPVADFTASVITGCSPLSVGFTDKSTNAPKSWNWDFGNGQLSNLQNPTMSFSVGTYTVTLVVRNTSGIDQVTKTNLIVVNPSPTANFAANKTLACLPATVQFTDLSVANAGTINQWEWHFNDGGPNVAGQNPGHSYANPGYYDVYLKVTSTTGCSAAVNFPRYIRVVNGVKADFDAIGPASCSAPYTMTYKNLTSGPGTLTYTWDLGNSTASTATDPPAVYPVAGNYTVKLKAQSEFGCVDSTQKSVPVKGITSTFSSTPDSVCLGAPITFQSTTNPAPVKVLWDFADGSSSTQLKPPPKTFAAPGIYPVKLISNFGNCTDTLIKNVKVKDKPIVAFTAPVTTNCKAPFTVNFQNQSPDVKTALWDFGDGATSTAINPSHTYTSAGNFDVTLTITDNVGCQNTLKKQFIYIIAPSAGVRNLPVGLCVGQPFTTDPIPSAVEGIASSSWNFGDGTPIDNSFQPTHTYTTAGFYTVTYTIVTNGGCTATEVYTNGVEVGDHSVVDFSADKLTPCRSDSVTFTNLSVPPGSTVLWTFGLPGDTGTSSLQNPKHKYSGVGFFDVKLKVTNNGCSDSLTKPSYIQALPPLADFNYTVDCVTKKTVAFRDSSVVAPPAGTPTYRWDFGDVVTATGTTPTHTYSGLGSYNVQLIVEEGACLDTITKVVQLVDEKANVITAKTTYCRNEVIKFESTNTTAFIKQYQWEVDGGTPYNGNVFENIAFNTSGNHTVRFIKTDINDCVDISNPVTVNVTGPTALFSIANNGGCKNSQVQFTDASVPAVGVINKWTYDFGDGSPLSATLQNPQHAYADTGLYIVKMTVTDNLNCTDTFDTTAYITKPIPFFSAEQTTFCPGSPLPFRDSSSGKALQYSWDFGDGGTANIQNPLHPYPAGKDSVYSVKLIITDTVGCKDSITRSNYIITKSPKPFYSAKDTVSFCPPLETKFNFLGKDYESFSWDFGDGGTSTLVNTSHFYNTYGNYIAKLYTVGYGGCIDSANITVNVLNPNAAASLTYTPNPPIACNELMVDFSLTIPPMTAYTVFFGDGAYDTTRQPTFSHFYSLPNNYSPYIFITDSTGCQAYVGGASGTIQIQGAVPLFGMDKNKFCDTGSVYFSDFSQDATDPIVTQTWNFGDGTGDQTFPNDATHTYTQPGLYAPTLTVVTQAGCPQTFTDTVRILATPRPIITSVDGVCNDLMIDFAGSLLVPPDTAITWKWTLGENQTSTLQNLSVKYADTGLHKITLEASNSLGCKSSTTKDITVFPLPSITVISDTAIIAGSPGLVMPVAYSANSVSFNWSPPTYLSCTNCANPFAAPKFTTTYKVDVTDANGCKNSRNLTLVVLCNNKNFFIPNTFSPNGDGSNDRFYPRGTGLDRIQALRIFNRWGEQVFEKRNFPANDAASGWDGSYKGKTAATDTYIYMIDIICENATIITYKGNITLIR